MLLVRFKANVYILTEQELVPAVHPWACWLLHTKDNQHKLHCPANLLCGQLLLEEQMNGCISINTTSMCHIDM